MLKMWQNYVDQYNKFQWWLSGLVYGLYIGSFIQKVRGIRNIWAPTLGEKMSWADAFAFTIEIQFGMTEYWDMVNWLEDRDYEIQQYNPDDHTGFCTQGYCVCSMPTPIGTT